MPLISLPLSFPKPLKKTINIIFVRVWDLCPCFHHKLLLLLYRILWCKDNIIKYMYRNNNYILHCIFNCIQSLKTNYYLVYVFMRIEKCDHAWLSSHEVLKIEYKLLPHPLFFNLMSYQGNICYLMSVIQFTRNSFETI